MSENPRDGVPVQTSEGLATQHYLPGCAPDEADGFIRDEVHRFSLLLKSTLRYYNVSLEEAQSSVTRIFTELGRK